MRYLTLSAGSRGNAAYIETEHARILIDAGISARQIELRLRAAEIEPETLDAVFVTHEHNDHISGLRVLAKRFDLDIFATYGTHLAMDATLAEVDDDKRFVIGTRSVLAYRDLEIATFPISHDAAEPVGYTLTAGKKKIFYMTDTGVITPEAHAAMDGADLYHIESNHDVKMLLDGPYSPSLKRRIRSREGHLSNEDCATILAETLMHDAVVVLSHLSEENNTPALARATTEAALEKRGAKIGEDVHLLVATPAPGNWVNL